MSQIVKTFAACAAFMAIGPTLILVNKYIMHDLRFAYPMFLSGIGVLFSSGFANLLVLSGRVTINNKSSVQGINFVKRILPIAISTAGTLAFGNYVYMYLDVGLIQMLKNGTPVLVMIGLCMSGIEIPSRTVVIAICMICFGTAVTCSFSPTLSYIGLLYMFISSSFEALRMVLTQYILKDLKLGVVESQYFMSPSTTLCLFMASLMTEMNTMIDRNAFSIIYTHMDIFIIAGIMGIIVNYLTSTVIQLTSSLNLKILVMLRNILLIVVSVLVYHEEIAVNEMLGYGIALMGFIMYNLTQMNLWSKSSMSSRLSSNKLSLKEELQPLQSSENV